MAITDIPTSTGRQLWCPDTRRRALVRADGTVNGIDYLEVLDDDAPAGVLPQQTLLVRLFLPPPAGLDGRAVRIEGGVRVRNIRVDWAVPATGAIPDPALAAFVAGLPDAENVLVVRTSARGDFSTYTLRLLDAAAGPESDDPPPGFDPILSSVAFSFKVECPTPFDCPTGPVCAPAPPPSPPPIDYLARDYAAVRQLLLDRLAVTLPDVSERSPADLMVMLAEVLAYRTDYLSYFQDAVGTEAYLGTARRRVSVRRHARLADYRMHEGANARTWIVFEVQPGGGADGATLPKGTPVRDATPPPTSAEAAASMARGIGAPVIFETMHDVLLTAARNGIPVHDWGDESCCLPRGATRATLAVTAADLALKRGDLLLLESQTDPTRRHTVRLSEEPRARQDPIAKIDVTEVRWFDADALPFALPLRGGVVARGNVVLADHGRTISGEVLPPPPTAADAGPYRPHLSRQGITQALPFDPRAARRAPAAQALRRVAGPEAALPEVTLRGGGLVWKAARELLSSDRFAPEFVVEAETDGTAVLRFGDDVLGRQPTSVLAATYRIGSGRIGNVGPETLIQVDAPFDGFDRVRNPLPAEGGADPEALETARLNAPAAFRTQERMVSDADHAEMAERHPQVQRAAATRRWTGSWYTVFLTVDRSGGRPIDAEFEAVLRAFLEPYRLACNDLEIDSPTFVSLEIVLRVCVTPGADRGSVRAALTETFSSGELSGDGRGFFHPDNFTFGQPVYLSRVIATAMAVPGVDYVSVDRFRRWGQPDRGELDAAEITLARLEIARLDNDPSRPENGQITFDLRGEEASLGFCGC